MIGQFSSQELGKKPFSEDVLYESDITLTIGIPVYNGEKTLFSTLASIFNQLDDLNGALKLEVLISDNASTDKTFEIVSFYKEKFPTILKYVKNDHNIGATQNIRKIIENASSDYLWFLGDDNLHEGALLYFARVLYYAPEKPKAIVVKSDVWDSTMSYVLHAKEPKQCVITKNRKKFLKKSREAVFFLGSIILNTKLAQKYVEKTDFDDFYPQTELLFHLLKKENAFFAVIMKPLVKQRDGSWENHFDLLKKFNIFLSMNRTIGKFFFRSPTYRISVGCLRVFLIKHYRFLSTLKDKNLIVGIVKTKLLPFYIGVFLYLFNIFSPRLSMRILGKYLRNTR
jgi:glycosyltransferase involved in cell wall biosynthesis